MARVRPGVELVRAILAPTRELITLDLPTFERPRKAISGRVGTGKWEASVAEAMNRERTLMVKFATRGGWLASLGELAHRLTTKLLAQGEGLMLIGRSDVRAVNLVWARQQVHIVEATDELTVFYQERNLVGSNLENRAGSLDLAGTIAKTRIEESRIVNAKFTIRWIERNHFGCEIRRNTNAFSGGENIKVAWLENQIFTRVLMTNFPELLRRIKVHAVQFDCGSISLRPVGDNLTGFGGLKIDRNSQAPLKLRLARNPLVHVDEGLLLIESFNCAITGAGASLNKAQLAEPHPGANRHGKGARNNFSVQFAFISLRYAVELGAVIGDQARENVQAPGRTLR